MKHLSLRTLWLFLLGIFSGLPLIAIGSTLKARLTEDGVSIATIGFLSSVTLPYALKLFWAPLFDRYKIPKLGRRRGWLTATAIAVSASLFALGAIPSANLGLLSIAAIACATASASFDVVVDAYRREMLASNELGLGTALFVNGYRVGMLISGAGALALADHFPWHYVYYGLSATMAFAAALITLAPLEPASDTTPRTIRQAYIEPLKDFMQRPGVSFIVVFILLYKIGDSLAGELTTPYYLNLGFTKTDIAVVVKGYGLFAMLAGALLGGFILLRANLWRVLFIFGIFQAASTLAFIALAQTDGPSKDMLALVISFENVTSGMGTAAFTALLAKLTNRAFSATQYAILSSLLGLPRAVLAAPSGLFVQAFGFPWFFWICTAIAIPGILLIPLMKRRVMLLE